MIGQIRVLLKLSARGFRTRIKASLLIVAGLLFVVSGTLPILTLADALVRAMKAQGDPSVAYITQAGSVNSGLSRMPEWWVRVVKLAPGVRRAPAGASMVYGGVGTDIFPKKPDGKPGRLGVAGLSADSLLARPGFQLTAGRMFRPGAREVIAGDLAEAEFAGLRPGDTVAMPDGSRWPVVGLFTAPGIMNSRLYCDTGVLMATLHRAEYGVIFAHLQSPQSFANFSAALAHDQRLSNMVVQRESDHYAVYARGATSNALVLVALLGLFLGLGAVAGTLNSMHAAVSGRIEEIAILRAIGFGGLPVAATVVLEAMLLAVLGALLAGGMIAFWLDGRLVNIQGVLRLKVTLGLFALAIVSALSIALIGALIPALRAARVTVIEALRSR